MANTYTSLHYHFTFSTKNREPWIALEIENRVWAFIGGIARHHKMTALQVGELQIIFTRSSWLRPRSARAKSHNI
jgi:hypothetical protein